MNSPALVGRGEYLAELDAALAQARDGGPAALLIGGEAGIGKTRLVTEFAALASGPAGPARPGRGPGGAPARTGWA
jgi:MoxR-like ATPase